MSGTERTQLNFFFQATLRGIENTFVQHKREMLAREVWLGHESLLRILLRPSAAGENVATEVWAFVRQSFDPEFVTLVEEILGEEAPAGP